MQSSSTLFGVLLIVVHQVPFEGSFVRGKDCLTSLTSRVKPWVIQRFLAFNSMDRTLKYDHSLESCLTVVVCGIVCFIFTHLVISGNLSISDLTLSRVKGLKSISGFNSVLTNHLYFAKTPLRE